MVVHSHSASHPSHDYVVPAWVSELHWTNRARWDKAVSFLKQLTKEDRVAVIYDDDGDGMSAAASVVVGVEHLTGHRPFWVTPFEHSPNYIDDLLPQKLQAEGVTKIITVDKTVDQKSIEFMHALEKVAPVLVIDHHKVYRDYDSPRFTMVKPQLVWETEPSSCPTAIFAYTLFSCVVDLSDRDWVPCIGIVSDSSYPRWKHFVDASGKKWGLSPVENDDPFASPFGTLSGMIYCTQILSSYQMPELLELLVDAHHPQVVLDSGFRALVNVVDDEVNEWMEKLRTSIQLFPELELAIAVVKPRHAIKSLLINKLSREKYSNWNLIMLQEVANGSRVTLSARRQDFKVPMNEMLEFAVKGLPESNAGGHIPAAGGLIRKEDEEKFIENVKLFLRAHYRKKE
ncbi:MAG: hypothetical protein FJY86_03670 [Candidatus Diapherotrites archaeon]|uniref:DHH family phosphoesterase n=1 Tax=Candidatus Iainarchaeum sp. TaxID=3101447 RepID=A0A8T4C7E7_9ARCH|nr:hypothetical protein [Candidatus Diapherotrites archaeon]